MCGRALAGAAGRGDDVGDRQGRALEQGGPEKEGEEGGGCRLCGFL